MTNDCKDLIVGLGNKFWRGNSTNRFGDVNRVYVVNPKTLESIMQSEQEIKGYVWNFDANGSHIVAFSFHERPFIDIFTIPNSLSGALEHTELDPRDNIFSENTQDVRRLRVLSDYAVMTLSKPDELVLYDLPGLERLVNLEGFSDALIAADDTHIVSSEKKGEGYILRMYELPSLEQVASIDDYVAQNLLSINVHLTKSDLYVIATPDPKNFGSYPQKVIVYSRENLTAERMKFDLTADNQSNPEHFAALGNRMFVTYHESEKPITYFGGSSSSQMELVLFELDSDDPPKRIQQSPHYEMGNFDYVSGLSDNYILLRRSENLVEVLNSDDLTPTLGLYKPLEVREPKLVTIKQNVR